MTIQQGLPYLIRAILFDLDGILSRGLNTFLPLDELWQLQQLVVAGRLDPSKIGFITGRSRASVEMFANALQAFSLGWIVESGSGVYMPETGRIMTHPLIPKDTYRATLQQVMDAVLEKLPDVRYEDDKHLSLSFNPPKGTPIEDFCEIIRDILSEFILKGLVFVEHSSSAVDVTLGPINKGSCVRFFCDLYGLKSENILIIGDGLIDQPGMEVVGHVGCPDNSHPKVKEYVKKRGGCVAKESYTAGAIEILDHYGLILPA